MTPSGAERTLIDRYRPTFEHQWRVAIVALFSMENVGARALYSFMKACGYDVDLLFLKEHALNRFDMPTDVELALFFQLLKERSIRAIGLSVRSPYMGFAAKLTDQIHEKAGIPVIWGGTAATLTPEWCVELGADYAIQGEAEESFAEMNAALASGTDPADILSLTRNTQNGPARNPLRPLLTNLDELPIPDFKDQNKFAIEFGHLEAGDPCRDIVRYETVASRGCPYHCAYCSNSVFHQIYKGLGPFVRTRSVEHVIRELESAREHMKNMGLIFFGDEVFGAKTSWLREFRDAYRERIGLPFECTTDPRTLTEERIVLLKEAGAREVQIGIQAGSERVRHEIFNRHVSNEDILRVARLVRKHRLFPRYDVIADNPYETREDKQQGIDLLTQLPAPFILNLQSLCYFPKTELTERALADGIITEKDVSGNSSKALSQWTVSFNYPRSPEDQCFNALCAMTSKWFIPRKFIRWASRSEWALSHPTPFVVISRVATILRLVVNGVTMLLKGELDFYHIRRFLRSIHGITR